MDPKQKVLTLAEEFKAFALKGNVVDLAVALIIGAAFTQVVNSLVKNILMPVIKIFSPAEQPNWEIPLVGGQQLLVGAFVGDVINFLFVALALFIMIRKFLNWVLTLHRGQAEAEVPPLTKDQQLLTEIRDLLKPPPQDAAVPPVVG
jgi:large conductance mechanosensitive channel